MKISLAKVLVLGLALNLVIISLAVMVALDDVEAAGVPLLAPPTGLTMAGPGAGSVDVSYTFTATLGGGSTPVDYTWEATEQSPALHLGGGSSDTAEFTWNTAGTKTITVTAANGQGTAAATYEIILDHIPLDIALVFDVSGSMWFETTCFGCWEPYPSSDPRYDVLANPWPNNGFFNQMPLQTTSTVTPSVGMALCTLSPAPITDADGNQYLVHEAELYSENGPPGSWHFEHRQAGQGFWALQRVNAGASAAGGDSRGAYMRPHPLTTYSQSNVNENPKLQGAAYNHECFDGPNLSGACWATKAAAIGESTPPSIPPWLEYDFTPTWPDGETHIWIRAQGAYSYADEWHGNQPLANPGTQPPDYRKILWWQLGPADGSDWSGVGGGNYTSLDQSGFQEKAENSKWRWVKLGSIGTVQNVQHTLRIYQGSSGFNLDKIIFTNYDGGAANTVSTNTGLDQDFRDLINSNTGKGPTATDGSATREACNVCNPIFGRTVTNAECSCKRTPTDTAPSLDYPAGGTGLACTSVQIETNQLVDSDLFHDVDPLRSAKEAVNSLTVRLNPEFDQLGFVAFSNDVKNGATNGIPQRSELQCLRWAAQNDPVDGDQACYATVDPISYTHIIQTVEVQSHAGSTNIGGGMLEGLEELGVQAGGDNGYIDSSCTVAFNDGRVCDRQGTAQRVLILLTDGQPNTGDGCSTAARNDLPWQGNDAALLGSNASDYNCALYYAREAAEANVAVYIIGLGPGIPLDFLATMATGTDPGTGDVYFESVCGHFFAAAHLDDLDAILNQILALARNCPPALSISKSGPISATANSAITYTLTITNDGPAPAHNLVITDAIPAGATYLGGGEQVGNIVRWVIPNLPANSMTQTTFAVAASQTLTNNDYHLHAAAGFEATGNAAVTTVIEADLTPKLSSLNGYIFEPTSDLIVLLENHPPVQGPYDIYLDDGVNGPLLICNNVFADSSGEASVTCSLASVPAAPDPGIAYVLYSVVDGTSGPAIAVAPEQVVMIIEADREIFLPIIVKE